MTRSKIQRIKFFLFLSIFLLSQSVACDGSFREKRLADGSVPSNDENASKVLDKVPSDSNPALEETHAQMLRNKSLSDGWKKTWEKNLTSKAIPGPAPAAPVATTPTIQTIGGEHAPSMNSGALMRGVFVIIGLSVLVMAYMVFRSFRLSKNRAQMVRKYGVLAHRQDVEMRPLPLDDDDDDDTTVFDASTIPSHRLQSQES